MKYIGGYSILDLADANVSAQANICFAQDKPVLIYGSNGEKFFADTITKDGTNIVITKGGKTITIANDNTITNVGDIQPHLYEHRITINGDDSNNNPYFIRIFINNNSNTPFTFEMFDNLKFNGVIVDSTYSTQAIEQLNFDFGTNVLNEIFSVFDNEAINVGTFDIDNLSIKDEITQLI